MKQPRKPGPPHTVQPSHPSPSHNGEPSTRSRQLHSTTRPEMPALRTPPRPSMPSWADAEEKDRITEVNDLAEQPTLDTRAVRDRPVIVRLDGAHAGEIHAIEQEAMTIGRHPSNQLHVDDPGISRFHARISKHDNAFYLDDLGSRNGTFVAGERLDLTQLKDGDLIQLGPRVTLRFTLLDEHQEQLMQRLYQSSTVDALTGAHNRKHFDERLKSEIAFAQRHDTNLALILFDIDHFKNVNDRFGHSAGDEVLRQVARCCGQRLRTEDIFARFGGEEFAVVLRGVSLHGAARLAERLRATVAAVPMMHGSKPIPVTISAGCATLECCSSASAEALIDAADERLYQAKGAGRNKVVASN